MYENTHMQNKKKGKSISQLFFKLQIVNLISNLIPLYKAQFLKIFMAKS